MSKARLHPTVLDLRGAMGPMVFRRRNGKLFASIKSEGTTKEPTPGQLAQRQLFKEAVAFAKFAKADPELSAFYGPIAQQRGISVYALAIGDFLSAPSILPLNLSNYKGRVGDPIVIRAMDDIGLAGMDVTIVSNQGAPIEQGKAVETGTGSGTWTYTATTPVALGSDIFIEVEGVDHAGNRVKMTESPRVGEDN